MRLNRQLQQASQLLGRRGQSVHQEHRLPLAVALRQMPPLAAAWSLEPLVRLLVAVLHRERLVGVHLRALSGVALLAGSVVLASLAQRERLAQRQVLREALFECV